ncbi:MAG TPA: hypothetical protein VGJ20_05690 [Xanthobacteraceae bacterium]
MTREASRNHAEARRYTQKPMTWYGRGSLVGVGLFVLAISALGALLKLAGGIR